MTFYPTTHVTILEPEVTEDALGDEVDTYRAVQTGVGIALQERSRRMWDPQSSRMTIVRYYEALVPAGANLQAGSRLIETSTGVYFHVQHVETPRSFTGMPPIRAELKVVEA